MPITSAAINQTDKDGRKGWECPKCKRFYSPDVLTCQKCNPKEISTEQTENTKQLLTE